MQHYELFFISPVQSSEKEHQQTLDKVVKLATSLEMKITESKLAGQRRLAYPIRKATQASYFLIELDAEQAQIKKIDKELRLMPDILRHLIARRDFRPVKEVRRERVIPEKAEVAEETIKKEEKKVDQTKKISLEDLDKKLDEILKEEV